jgi:uncharacterized protein YndB with AHSA1/START domain
MAAPAPIVTVHHAFASSRERVFDAWLDARGMESWMFGPSVRNEEIVHLRADPRVGGHFSFLVRRDGKPVDHVGSYLEIDRPRRLVFTWSAVVGDTADSSDEPSLVTIELAAEGDGCELTLTHRIDPKWADAAEQTRAGWAKLLDQLDRALRTDQASPM